MRGLRIADNLDQPLDQRQAKRPGDGPSLTHGPVHQPGTTVRRPSARVIVRIPFGSPLVFNLQLLLAPMRCASRAPAFSSAVGRYGEPKHCSRSEPLRCKWVRDGWLFRPQEVAGVAMHV